MGILVNLLLLDAVIICGFTLWLSIYSVSRSGEVQQGVLKRDFQRPIYDETIFPRLQAEDRRSV